MATSDKPKAAEDVPPDLLPVIRKSGILTDRQFEELRARVLRGDLPFAARELASRLVRDNVLTEYQAKRFLSNKPYGLTVGRYVIQDRIGSGSMGRVYKAQHQLMDRLVAIKIIAPEIVTNTRVVARFQREMKMVGRLDHPNVVRAFDADQIGNVLYIVMEYVAGQSLGQKYRSEGVLQPLDVIGYGAQACLGLAHAHEQAIVHRDIKPSNLLINNENQVKVLDLGLGVLMEADDSSSFATADGIAVGTIDYMSPEQACGKDVDGRSDLYSLGCAMYHLMTGRMPFPGDSPVERLGRRINGRPVPITDVRPDVPPPVVEVMERLMANKLQDRFQNAGEAADALLAVATRRKPAPSSGRKITREPGVVTVPPPAAVDIASSAASVPPQSPPQVVTVRPSYPAWFRPVANLVEGAPVVALITLVLTLAAVFALGFVTSMFLR
jgi:serine/threonine-protein kinase